MHHNPDAQLGLHPNPAGQQAIESIPEPILIPAVLHLRDVSGRVTVRRSVEANVATIDLQGVMPGSYLVEVEGRALATRLVVE